MAATAKGSRGVDARWHAPVHCRHIRLEVMAFFSTLPSTVCARTYTRSYLNLAKPIPFVDGSAAKAKRTYVCRKLRDSGLRRAREVN